MGHLPAPSVTIATWNVRKPAGPGDPCFAAIVRKLSAIPVDIWVLTETHAELRPDGMGEPVSSPGNQPHCRPAERATMIWTRCDCVIEPVPTFPDRPASNAPAKAATYAVRDAATSPAACALVQTPLGPLLVYGTIITWANDKGPEQQSGYAVETLHAIAAHAEDWQRLRRRYPDIPLCVAGDLNTTLDGRRLPTIQCSDELRRALAAADMRHVTRTLDYAIDHICLPLAWAERASDPLWWQTTYVDATGDESRPVSDHRGVYVTISAHEL